MNIDLLRIELALNHPTTGVPYDADDAVAATQLNEENVSINKKTMTGSEILNAVDPGEWATRSDEQKQSVWNIVHLGEINPFGVEATLMTGAFSGTPDGLTIAALVEARKIKVSRAMELGLSNIRAGTVAQARAL